MFDNNDNFLILGASPYGDIEIWDWQNDKLIYTYNKDESYNLDFDIDPNNNILSSQYYKLIFYKGNYNPITVEEEEITTDILYPNPTNNIVNIEFTLKSETKLNIELSDINGKPLETLSSIVYPVGLNSYQYNCSNLSSGTYFIKISSAEFNKVYKFVKMY